MHWILIKFLILKGEYIFIFYLIFSFARKKEVKILRKADFSPRIISVVIVERSFIWTLICFMTIWTFIWTYHNYFLSFSSNPRRSTFDLLSLNGWPWGTLITHRQQALHNIHSPWPRRYSLWLGFNLLWFLVLVILSSRRFLCVLKELICCSCDPSNIGGSTLLMNAYTMIEVPIS